MEKIIKVKKLKESAVVPNKATSLSAGFDLYACIDSPVTINPNDLALIGTGLAIEIENKKYTAFLFARSGLGVKHGITLSNGVGVVDNDYRGEIKIGLCNVSSEPYTISNGERIAQMVIMKTPEFNFVVCDQLSDTERSSGGFGSTGK